MYIIKDQTTICVSVQEIQNAIENNYSKLHVDIEHILTVPKNKFNPIVYSTKHNTINEIVLLGLNLILPKNFQELYDYIYIY